MAVRQFKLINANGETFDLMRTDAFFHSPDGLGFSIDAEYAQIGNSYQLIDTEAAQKTPTGEMIFSGYSVYMEFAAFIAASPLKLCYMPISEWAYLDCIITKFSKSEIDHSDNRLHCDIDFTATSKWYIPRTVNRTASEVTNAKKYSYPYPYQYAESINGIISLTNNASEECPSVLTIVGPIVNPSWSLAVAGKVIQSGAVTATIESGHKLVVSSKDNDLKIAEYVVADNTFVQNLYQASDFTKDNFLIIPVGTSTLTVTGTSASEISAYIEVEEIHETV